MKTNEMNCFFQARLILPEKEKLTEDDKKSIDYFCMRFRSLEISDEKEDLFRSGSEGITKITLKANVTVSFYPANDLEIEKMKNVLDKFIKQFPSGIFILYEGCCSITSKEVIDFIIVPNKYKEIQVDKKEDGTVLFYFPQSIIFRSDFSENSVTKSVAWKILNGKSNCDEYLKNVMKDIKGE